MSRPRNPRRARRRVSASNPATSRTTRSLEIEPLEARQLMAVVNVGGEIADGTIWLATDVHVLTSNAHVPAGATLTIQPGAIVKGQTGLGREILVDGTLIADGTAGAPIIFTNDRDDTAGGDTNGDGVNTLPFAGSWSGIRIGAGSTGNLLDFVEMRFGGSNSAVGSIFADGPLTMTNSTIRSSNSAGLRIVTSNPVISGITFANNAIAASMDLGSNPAISGVTMTANGINGLQLDAGTLPGNAFWNDPNIVYRLGGDVTVPVGTTLTIGAGQIIKSRTTTGDEIIVLGTLTADGTPAAPIIFTNDRDDTAGGDTNGDAANTGPFAGTWDGVQFRAGSVGNLLDNVEVRWAGANSARGAVFVGSPLTMTNSAIRNSSSSGLRIEASNPVINTITFAANFAAASMDLGSNPAISGVTMTGNSVNALVVDAGSLPGNAFWNDPAIVYRLNGDVTVPAGMTLTVGAGQIVKARTTIGDTIIVNGTLTADGTAVAPIIFSNDRDDEAGGDTNGDGANTGPFAGTWDGLQFQTGSVGNLLDHVEVRWAGALSTSGAVYAAAPLTMTDSLVRHSSSSGVRIVGANPAITNITLQSNSGAAMSMDLASNPEINGVTIANNGVNALVLDSGTLPADGFWDDRDIVYRLNGPVTVPVGRTLTVGAGQVVKARTTLGDHITVDGTLLADGEAASPIVFTNDRDDTVGGDTNNDLGNTLPFHGTWNSIRLSATSSGNVLDFVDIRYAGASSLGALEIAGPTSLTNSVMRHSSSSGLRIDAASPVVSSFAAHDNFGAAASMDLASNPDITGVTLLNNGANALALDGGTLVGDGFWDDPEIVYRPSGDITVPEGATLTIGAGQIIKTRTTIGQDIIVAGTLVAVGTPSAPIIFTGERDDTAGGDTNNDGANTGPFAGVWNSLQLTSTSTGNLLDHVEVRYGGSDSSKGALFVGGPATISNSTIRHTSSVGLRIEDANPVITNITFASNFFAASMNLASNPDFSGVTMSGNTVNAITLDAGTLPDDAVWDDPEIVYRLGGNITVPIDVTLTIAAGQVIKARTTAGDDIIVAGTLLANGTNAAPVIFTGERDDTANGDSNGDGGATGTFNGLWGGLTFQSTSTGSSLEHVEVRFAGANTFSSAIAVDGGSLTVSRSVVRNSSNVGLRAINGGELLATNNLVFANSGPGMLADGAGELTARNNTIDGNGRGIDVNAASATLSNNLVTFNFSSGIRSIGTTTIDAQFNNVFNPQTTNYVGLANLTGVDGNLSADPKYFNRATSQYRLRPGSPAIDRGTSDAAPATDFLGNARFDDPNILNLGGGATPFVDIGALERQEISLSDVDLRAVAVSGPATGLQGETVTINWTIDNVGAGPALGSWFDAVYLSTDAVFSPDDLRLGEAQHTGDLGSGASYANSLNVKLPGVLPGDYYFIVRANARNEIFEALALENDALAAVDPVAMDLPALQFGAPVNGQLAATGDKLYYRVSAPAGADIAVNLTGPAGATNELYIRYADLPSRQAFDERGIRPNQANQSVSIAGTQAGLYIVEVLAANLVGFENFTLTASLTGFGIQTVTPNRGSNTGSVTLNLTGAQFSAASQVALIDSAGQTLAASQVFFTDSGHISATFNLVGRPLGLADVRVTNPGNVVQTLPDAVNIVAGQPGRLTTNVIAPSRARLGTNFSITVEFTNTGDTDLVAPIVRLSSTGLTQFSFFADGSRATPTLDLVGISPNEPTGILAPGATGRVTVYGRSLANGDEIFTLSILNFTTDTIDWPSLSATLRPVGLGDAEWDALFARIQANLGGTYDAVQRAIAQDATLLPAARGFNYSLVDVFQLEVEQAYADLNPSIAGRLFLGDTAHPLANAVIRLVDPATDESFETVSNTDGTFLFPSVVPGTYAISYDNFVPNGVSQLVMAAADQTNVELIAAAAGRISGGVFVSPGAIPARGALVRAIAADGRSYVAVTNNNGLYDIGGLPAGTYSIQATAGSFTTDEIGELEIAIGQDRRNVNLAVQAGASIRGKVTGPGGPLAGVLVSAVAADGSASTAVTDAAGDYVIGNLPARVYTVAATSAGLTRVEIASVTPAPGELVSNVNLLLATAGRVQGQITQVGGGQAASFVLLKFTGAAGTFTAQADVTGAYLADHLPAGAYTMTLTSADFMTISAPVVVTAGATATLNAATALRGEVSGVVTNSANGQPLEKVFVYVAGDDGIVASVLTDASGAYQFSGLDAGSYRVLLGDTATPGVARANVAFSVNNRIATANLAANIVGSVAGVVRAADGTTPLAGVTVTLVRNGNELLSMLTNASGEYVFLILSAGTYELRADSENAYFPALTGQSITAGVNLTGRNFTAGTIPVSGVVRNGATLALLAGAQVIVERLGIDGLPIQAVGRATAADGTFQIAGLVAGDYRFVVAADGHALATQTVTISAALPGPIEFDLVLETTLVGSVRDADTGLPVAGAAVTLISLANPRILLSAETDDEGNYAFGSLPVGNYILTAQALDHQTLHMGSVTLSAAPSVLALLLEPAQTTIQGTITGAIGPLANAVLMVRDAAGTVFAVGSTDAAGNYLLNQLPAGSFSIIAAAGGYAPSAVTPLVVVAGVNQTGVNFSLAALAITDAEGDLAPLEGTDANWASKFDEEPQPAADHPTLAQLSAITCDSNSVQSLREPARQRILDANTALSDLRIARSNVLGPKDEVTGEMSELKRLIAKANAALAKLQPLGNINATININTRGGNAQSIEFKDIKGVITNSGGAMNDVTNGLAGGDFAGLADIVNGNASGPGFLDFIDNQAGYLAGVAQALQGLNRAYLFFALGIAFRDGYVRDLRAASAALDAVRAKADSMKITDLVNAANEYAKKEQAYLQAVTAAKTAFTAVTNAAACGCGTQAPAPDGFGTFAGTTVCTRPPEVKPVPPRDVTTGATTPIIFRSSFDPNDKVGPAGFGPQSFVQDGLLSYEIDFENDPALGATIAAQEVFVTDTLDADLDLTTLEFVAFGFNNFEFDVPAGLSNYETTIDLRPDGIDLLVPVKLEIDPVTRVLRASFRSLDPLTGLPPEEFEAGFLPVNDDMHSGEGFFKYRIRVLDGKPTGTQIVNQASIVFDVNAPILTPTTVHTLDITGPSSNAAALPASVSSTAIPVSWSGADAPAGSGIARYTVFVSDNGGPFQVWLDNTGATSGTYLGLSGHTYQFHTVARDNVGLLEAAPAVADSQTTVLDASAGLIEITLVEQPTVTDSLGQVAALPPSAASVDEWQSPWIEVWAHAEAGGNAIAAAAANISYNPAYFVAQQPVGGAAFPTFTKNVNTVTGRIQVNGAGATAAIGQGNYVLLARIQLAPKPTGGVPIQLTEPEPIAPVDEPWVSIVDDGTAVVTLAGQSTAAVPVVAPPATDLFPFQYDLDDDGRVGFGDFAIFAAVFFTNVNPAAPASFKADFAPTGRVDFGDFSLFSANFFTVPGLPLQSFAAPAADAPTAAAPSAEPTEPTVPTLRIAASPLAAPSVAPGPTSPAPTTPSPSDLIFADLGAPSAGTATISMPPAFRTAAAPTFRTASAAALRPQWSALDDEQPSDWQARLDAALETLAVDEPDDTELLFDKVFSIER